MPTRREAIKVVGSDMKRVRDSSVGRFAIWRTDSSALSYVPNVRS
jgi:hypothetical protein